MGLLNSALQTSRSALLSYQSALQVVGNNISSVGSSDYTRLTPQLDPLQGNGLTRGLQPGAGVALTDIQRNIDEALEAQIRAATHIRSSAAARHEILSRVETLFDDLSGSGLSAPIRGFLDAFEELRNTPEETAIRDLVLSSGTRLAQSFTSLRAGLAELGASTDAQIPDLVASVNRIASEMADLNSRIVRAEARNTGQATGLRDQRDALLRDLNELIGASVREQPNGTINVYVGSEALVQGDAVRELTTVRELDGEFMKTSVRFLDTGAHVPISGGRLLGIIIGRDRHAYARIASLDELAAAIIEEVNSIHVDGQGIAGFRSVIGTAQVAATDAALDSPAAGLNPPPRQGSFFISVRDDATGTPLAYQLNIVLDDTNGGTSLESFVEQFNETVEGVTASLTADGRLALTAADGVSFQFGHDGQTAREDTSQFLRAMGINTFFVGGSASDMAVNPQLAAQPLLLAAAASGFVGDGTNAGRIAALDAAPARRLEGLTITEFYNAIAGSVAVTTAASRDESLTTESVLASLRAQRESVSGVNLDEEAISLVKYERAFQGVSRFVSVVDGLIAELMTLVR